MTRLLNIFANMTTFVLGLNIISESSAHKYCVLGSEIRNMSESVSSGTVHSKPQASMIPFQNLYLRQYCGTVKNPKHIEFSCVEKYIETSRLSLPSASRSIFFMISSYSASPCANHQRPTVIPSSSSFRGNKIVWVEQVPVFR